MRQLANKILENKEVAPGIYKMRIKSSYLARAISPGQFVEVKCSDALAPLLRRPFSVHRILKNGIEILYEVVGSGTEALSERKAGGSLDVIGPLGNGFSLPSTIDHRPSAILIAGGMGVAPLVSLAEELAYSVERIAYSKNREIHVFIGAKTASHIACADNFKKIGCRIHITTDDGSKGAKGPITSALTSFLTANRYTLYAAAIYACGPNAMLETVARIARERKIPCQVSLEERMACGVGVCLGCPIKVKSKITSYELRVTSYEYKMVCKDGPVFDAEEIAW